jgi:hypothetical protein
MRLKLLALIISLLFMGSVLTGCAGSDHDQAPNVFAEPIKTEKTLPDDFYELAERGVLVSKATNQAEFNEQWEYFRLGEAPAKVDWDNKAAIFLGIFESGSCPYEFKYAELNAGKTDLIIHLEDDSHGRACTDDATPRTIVLAVDKDETANVNHVEIRNFYGTSPRVEFYDHDAN